MATRNHHVTQEDIDRAIQTTSPIMGGGRIDNNLTISHLATDGNLHVPATGTTNSGKFLKAKSATAGNIGWENIVPSDIVGIQTPPTGNYYLANDWTWKQVPIASVS